MAKLLLLGGPPAVGKTTVAPLLAERLAPSAWLDADDVWRIFPFEVTDRTRALVEANVVHVLRGFIEARYEYVLLTWALHREDLIQRLLAPLAAATKTAHVIHLVADPSVLQARLEAEPERGRSPARAHDRSARIATLPYPKVDTSQLTPQEVAERILRMLR